MQTRDWEGEDGVKRYRTEIVAENMIMLDRKGAAVSTPVGEDGEGSSFQAPRAQRSIKKEPTSDAGQPQEEEVNIDDLPF